MGVNSHICMDEVLTQLNQSPPASGPTAHKELAMCPELAHQQTNFPCCLCLGCIWNGRPS
jgi:hypothetical protein